MKKTRRIEITAFRRQVTIYSGDEHWKNANDLSPSCDESRPNTDGSDLTIDLGVGCDATLNAARAGELVLLAEALIESEGKTSVAAKKLGLSRSTIYSKLRRLGLPLRQLKARLNVIRHGRAARSISDAKARL